MQSTPISQTSHPGDGRDAPATTAAQWALARAGLDHLCEGISVFDADLRLVTCNRRFLELLDFPPEFGLVGTPFSDLIRFNARRGEYGPGDVEQQVEERCRLARGFHPHCIERTRPDGTVLEIRGNPIPQGGFVTVYADITARKRAEAALRESHAHLEERIEARTRALEEVNRELRHEVEAHKRTAEALRESEKWVRLVTDAVPALIGYADRERRYRFANQRYQDWFGLSPIEIVGKRLDEVLGDRLYAQRRTQVRTALEGEEVTVEHDITDIRGRTRHVRAAFIPHLDEEGKVLGFFILAHDVTEQHEAQAALLQAQKMEAVGQLTGGIAHDFNNLLTIILGNLDILEEALEGTGELFDTVGSATSAAERGADLTRRLLAFSRRQQLRPKVVALNELVVEIEELLRPTLGKGIEIAAVLGTPPRNALVDPAQLENAVLNLAINARDAMPTGGRLTITTGDYVVDEAQAPGLSGPPPGRYAVLSVSDKGTGMTTEVAARAFEPFFTTKDAGAGSGLGLSMVYGFAEQSGGHVRIQSTPGRGTTVALYLPMVEKENAPAALPGVPSQRRSYPGAAALVVEDDPAVLSFVCRALKEMGFGQVYEADGSETALAVLDSDRPLNLLVTDLVMPGRMGGHKLAQRALEARPELRVLTMSGHHERGAGEFAAASSDLPLLRKPFRRADLAEAIGDLMAPSPTSEDGAGADD